MIKSDLPFTPHQQKAIQSEGHLALTANAGSGKTFVLMYKYLDAAEKLNGDVSKIAAITFTNKAANELYDKISKLVDKEISTTIDKDRLRLLYRIRRNLVHSYISTIHSFCIELLKNYPIEAGIDANFLPIDQTVADELIEISVEEVIDNLFYDKNNSTIIKDLIRFFGSRFRLQTELRRLLNDRKKVYSIREKIYSAEDEEVENYFNSSFKKYLDEVINIFSPEFVELLEKVNNSVLEVDNNEQIALDIKYALNKFKSDNDFISLLKVVDESIITTKGEIKTRGYLSKEQRQRYFNETKRIEELFARLKVFVKNEIDFSLHKELVFLGKKILFLFELIESLYEKKKKKNSYIDFDDILIKTKLLLKNQKIREELSEKFKYLMVDEYQDTDETQYEIFLPILDDLKSGNLFIVGDDKQSIYRFRNADPQVFEKTKLDILNQNKDTGLQLLPDSFRMSKEICLFCNYLFNRILNSTIPLFNEMKNVPIVCAKDPNEVGEIEFLADEGEDDKPNRLADFIALKILELCQKSLHKFSEIAVLVTKRKHFDELESVFTQRNIPYRIIGGRGFFQRQIVSDIRNYLSFISNLNDDVSLVAVLRSPFFMLSDSEIAEISFCDGSSFYEKLKCFNKLSGKFQKQIDILENHIALCSSLPISILIKKILSDTDYLVIIKNRHDGEQEIANIEKIISIARKFDTDGFKTLFDFVNYLDDSINNKPDESQADGLLSEAGVQLMTIHQAKGLQFPVVFLYRCESYPESSSNKARTITVNKDFGLLFQIQQKGNPLGDFQKPPILLLSDFIEQSRDLAEIKRLLYVGVTRAEKKLFLTYQTNEKAKYNPYSFVKLLDDVFNLTPGVDITIEDDLAFLKKENGNYYNEVEKVKVNIKVTPFSDSVTVIENRTQKKQEEYLINTQKIQTGYQHYIISATKISIFEKCPMKYHLTYNIGLAKLLKSIQIKNREFSKVSDFVDDLLEQENQEDLISEDLFLENRSSERIGRIAHKILERNLSIDRSLDLLTLESFSKSESLNKSDKKLLIDLLELYYKSDFYKKINQFKNFRNEFEILVKENNVLLKGIIDKLIIDKDSILIIDYKTDIVEPDELQIRYADYQIQMKFYLYISMRFFESYDKFFSNLVFLKYPDKVFEMSYNRDEMKTLRNEIFSLIDGILNKNTSKNLFHCDKCIYSLSDKNCIVN